MKWLSAEQVPQAWSALDPSWPPPECTHRASMLEAHRAVWESGGSYLVGQDSPSQGHCWSGVGQGEGGRSLARKWVKEVGVDRLTDC